MERLGARARIAQLCQRFEERDADLVGGDPLAFEGYPEQLARARDETGLGEACIWGWADIDGVACAVVVFDFAFLGGSMGLAVGEKVARAFDAARRRGLGVVTVTASGGARMQEGMVSLVQMAKTVEARTRHGGAGLGHVTLLTSPTTGGVYASFASLADLIFAEPDATVGFAGPRVVSELTGEDPPDDVHRAEYALAHGMIDAIVARGDESRIIGRALRALVAGPGRAVDEPVLEPSGRARSAWDRLALARDPHRPKGRDIADALLTDAVELHGDRTGDPDGDHVVTMLGAVRASGRRVAVVAQDASGDGRLRPAGFRKAQRTIALADRIGLPVVTIVDTRGADPLPSSEGHGVAHAIASTFAAMLNCQTPTLAVVTGEGGSGGALAMAPADRILCWENAVFSVIAPRGAAQILYRDPTRAAELAERLKITADDLASLGIVDRVVPEPPDGSQADPVGATAQLAGVIASELETLVKVRERTRRRRRRRRWRTLAGDPA